MLTSAQQKVKQELEELKANGHYHRQDDEVVITPKTHSLKKAFSVMGIGLLLLLFGIFIFGVLSPNQEMFFKYILKEQEYNLLSMELFADCLEADQMDESRLERSKTKHEELLLKVKKMQAPAELKAHKQDFINLIEQRAATFAFVSGTKPADPIQFNKFLLELDIKQELAKESLLKAFDREKIKYLENEDGSVQYRINHESYQFSW